MSQYDAWKSRVPEDWPSVRGGRTWDAIKRTADQAALDRGICPDCLEPVGDCDATCGCADCRRRDCEAADLAESLIPVTRGVE